VGEDSEEFKDKLKADIKAAKCQVKKKCNELNEAECKRLATSETENVESQIR